MAITNTPNNAAFNLLNVANGKGASKGSDTRDSGLPGIGTTQGLKDQGTADTAASTVNDEKKTAFSDLLSQKMQSAVTPPAIAVNTDDAVTPAAEALTSQAPDPNLVNLALQQMGVQLNQPNPSTSSTSDNPINPANAAENLQTANPSAIQSVLDEKSARKRVYASQTTTQANAASGTATENPLAADTATTTASKDFSSALTNALNQTNATSRALTTDGKNVGELEIKSAADTAATSATVGHTGNPALTTATPEKITDNSMRLGSIQANLHSPQFANEAAEHVKFAISQRIQSAHIDIHPAELGPISINLQMHGSHSASINFSAVQPETRQALENALPRLRELLADAGIQLSDAQVGQQSFAQAQQQSFQAAQTSQALNSVRATHAAEETARTVTVPLNRQSDASGLLDLYA